MLAFWGDNKALTARKYDWDILIEQSVILLQQSLRHTLIQQSHQDKILWCSNQIIEDKAIRGWNISLMI